MSDFFIPVHISWATNSLYQQKAQEILQKQNPCAFQFSGLFLYKFDPINKNVHNRE